jgi:hypothetical protein
VLLILPADFFDYGPPICLSVLLFHQKCYACGLTRGIQHLIHFQFAAAAGFNKLSFIVLPALFYGWCEQVWTTYKKIKRPKAEETSTKQKTA